MRFQFPSGEPPNHLNNYERSGSGTRRNVSLQILEIQFSGGPRGVVLSRSRFHRREAVCVSAAGAGSALKSPGAVVEGLWENFLRKRLAPREYGLANTS